MTDASGGAFCALPGASGPAQPAYQDASTIRDIVRSARTVAIVGLSPNELRPSHFVGFYLQRHGYRIVPVNPKETEILGETSYPSLLDIPFPVDVIDVFRAPSAVPAIAEDAVKIGAKALWLQFGVISPEGAAIAQRGGLNVVMDRCMKVEHARHLGRMHWYGLNTGVVNRQRAPTNKPASRGASRCPMPALHAADARPCAHRACSRATMAQRTLGTGP